MRPWSERYANTGDEAVILIAYDGSPDATAAVDHASELFHGHPVTVLTVWEPFTDSLAQADPGIGLSPAMADSVEIDRAYEQSARDRAAEGVERAQRAGLNAQPRTRTRHTTVANAILDEAHELDARAIVMGTRGLTGIRSLLVGSVSHAVLQHADRAVVIVPSPDVAGQRGEHRRKSDFTG